MKQLKSALRSLIRQNVSPTSIATVDISAEMFEKWLRRDYDYSKPLMKELAMNLAKKLNKQTFKATKSKDRDKRTAVSKEMRVSLNESKVLISDMYTLTFDSVESALAWFDSLISSKID